MDVEVEILEEAKEMGPQEPKQTVKARSRRPPHNYVAIVKDSDVPIQTSPLDKLCDQLYDGVVLQKGKRKYWVDRDLNKNCFMVFARELEITWGDTPEYWEWTTVKESGNVDVEVAVLRNVCWLFILGKFRTVMLSPNTLYEVSLVALMTDQSSQGWRIPVKLGIVLPDESTMERMEDLQNKPRGKWINILMGKFTTSSKNIGEIRFSISETSSIWKHGLVVKGFAFRPKN